MVPILRVKYLSKPQIPSIANLCSPGKTGPAARDQLPSNAEVMCSNNDMAGDWADSIALAEEQLDTDCLNKGGVVPFISWKAWVSGHTQIFYCNYNLFNWETCDVGEYEAAHDLIDKQCGIGKGGWVWMADWKESIGRDPTNGDGTTRHECF